jgi:hypothetical protein
MGLSAGTRRDGGDRDRHAEFFHPEEVDLTADTASGQRVMEEVMTTRRFLTVTIGALMVGGLLGAIDAPAGAPEAPTDLPGLRQSRDQTLPVAQRFVIPPAFNGEAVLDKDTGLVWEKSPQKATARWSAARRICTEKNVGGRKGWRLPSLPELRSLVDPSVAPPGPTLPPGHPFLAVQSAVYWSETRVGDNPSGAWAVHFGLGGGSVFINWAHGVQLWCVHGGMNADQH